MEVITTLQPSDGSLGNASYPGAITVTTNPSSVENIVVLKSNPLDLPMVCGLCGSQYATAKELENHLNEHKPGFIKRGRGRPKGSLSKQKLTNDDSDISIEKTDSAEGDDPTILSRKSRRAIKRPYSDLYVDENEMDQLIGDVTLNMNSYTKEVLPLFNEKGVPIARMEDFVTQTFTIDKLPESEGLTEEDLNDGSILNSPGQQGAHPEDAHIQICSISHSDLACEGSDEQDNVTHIEVCLEAFTAADKLNTPKTLMCEFCAKVLPANAMKAHMLTNHTRGSLTEFLCPQGGCKEIFNSIPNLRQHIVESHCDSDLPEQAISCHIRSSNSLVYKGKELDDRDDVATTCDICNKVFNSKRAHSSHMKAHTRELETVKCDRCGKEFRHRSALKFHNSMMPECDKPKYVCNICGYKAVTPWRLQSHQMQVHSNERPFTCQYCQKAYKTKEMLKQHVYKLHTGTPTHECDICNKKFFYAAELREHKQLHNSTKDFICPICNRAFKTMHVFRGHMNGKHSDTWYSCGFCKFTTSHKKSMKRHMVLVHKLKNVTLEVTPEDSGSVIPQQVEIIQADDDVQMGEHHPQVLSTVHVQYEADVDQVVLQSDSGEVISQEHIEEIHHLITPQHDGAGGDVMNASEVSQVLVSLSSAAVQDKLVHTTIHT